MARNTATRDQHRAVIRRTKPDCALCLQPIDYALKYPHPKAFVVDHVMPVVIRPDLADELSNKQPAHADCNWAKAAKVEQDLVSNAPRTFVTTRAW